MTTVVIVNGYKLEEHERQALQNVYGADGSELVYGEEDVTEATLRNQHGPNAAYIQADTIDWSKIGRWDAERQQAAGSSSTPHAKILGTAAAIGLATGLATTYALSKRGGNTVDPSGQAKGKQ